MKKPNRDKLNQQIKKLKTWFNNTTKSEKILVLSAAVGLSLFLVYFVISSFSAYFEQQTVELTMRSQQAEQINQLLQKYHGLKKRSDIIEANLNQSQLSFEQLTQKIDEIVKESLGNNDYERKKSDEVKPFGADFEKQEVIITLKAVTLEQLVKLLYEFEKNKQQLFIGSLEVTTIANQNQFATIIEVASIRKKEQA